MKTKLIYTLLLTTLITLNFSFAQNTTNSCLDLKFNMKLKSNDRNTKGEVKKLQNFLLQYGNMSGTANGNFGPATLKAVKAFQEANGLIVTGVVGKVTREKVSKVSCKVVFVADISKIKANPVNLTPNIEAFMGEFSKMESSVKEECSDKFGVTLTTQSCINQLDILRKVKDVCIKNYSAKIEQLNECSGKLLIQGFANENLIKLFGTYTLATTTDIYGVDLLTLPEGQTVKIFDFSPKEESLLGFVKPTTRTYLKEGGKLKVVTSARDVGGGKGSESLSISMEHLVK
jgi:peptidoglycan hydrolase-like protein with peptidoglycan-binding domain